MFPVLPGCFALKVFSPHGERSTGVDVLETCLRGCELGERLYSPRRRAYLQIIEGGLGQFRRNTVTGGSGELTFSVQYFAMSSISFCISDTGSLKSFAAVSTRGISLTCMLIRLVELTESRCDVDAESYPESE